MEFEFGMKFKIGAEGADPKELVERLGEAGCDDAVVGTGVGLDASRWSSVERRGRSRKRWSVLCET